MDVLNKLSEKLAKHPEIQWIAGDDAIRIEPPVPDGFAVELQNQGGECTVYLGSGGWHQHFDDGAEAVDFIGWCFSGDARLREVWRGGSLQKSVLEAHVNGEWQQTSVTGYFLVPFWRKKAEVVLRNPNLLSPV